MTNTFDASIQVEHPQRPAPQTAGQRIAELEEENERLRGSLRRSLEGWHEECGEIRRPHMHRGVDCDEEHPCDCGGHDARDDARALAWPDGPFAKRRAALAPDSATEK